MRSSISYLWLAVSLLGCLLLSELIHCGTAKVHLPRVYWEASPHPSTPMTGASRGDLAQANEGITTDGHVFFFNNVQQFWKVNATTLAVISEAVAVPSEVRASGYVHMGDSQYLSSSSSLPSAPRTTAAPVILAGLSDYPHRVLPPRVMAFDVETFQPTGFSCNLTEQPLVPWVAVDESTDASLLYSSDYDTVTHVNVYNLSSSTPCALVRRIELSLPIIGAQGGVFVGRELYIGSDDTCVYSVDVESGQVTLQLCRLGPYEMEGITYLDLLAEGHGSLHFFPGHIFVPELQRRVLFHFQPKQAEPQVSLHTQY